MAQDAPGLSDGRVFCEACGAVHETATALLAESRAATISLSAILGQKDAKITRLEQGKADKLQRSKNIDKAREVLHHWQAVCMPNAREIESEDRLANVLARLAGGFTVDDLKRCADGYAKRPYVVNGKRSANGTPTERHADAELIYRDPKRVQAGLALAEAPAVTEPPTDWQRIDWRKVKWANHREIIRALTESSGKPYYDQLSRSHHTECPRCQGALTVFDPDLGAGGSMLRCTGTGLGDGCDLDEKTFFRAMREDDATVAVLTGAAA